MDKFIKNLARGAGKILREGFRKKFNSTPKSEHFWDIVTEYDLAAEKFIVEKIKKKYPTHGILSEEGGEIVRQKKQFWVIDPLDGTHAFIRGLAQFSVSIAFVERNQIKFGAVYDPMGDELFFARKGNGATVNGKKILTSGRNDLMFCTTALIMGSVKTTKQERKAIYDQVL